MHFADYTNRVKTELGKPLPGLMAQLTMTSSFRLREIMEFKTPENAIRSSVLIVLYPGADSLPTFVVMLRPQYDGVHGGQVSLPGGKQEENDADLLETALRETREETGMDTSEVEVLGKLTELFIPPSHYLVQPFVGSLPSKPLFRPQPEEVDRLFEIRITDLLNDRFIEEKELFVRGSYYKVPTFSFPEVTIWGATAMILGEFKEVLKKAGL
jgi:8-oxo-dGTP pyrophosphatase MutT (NUDIX family)